MSLTPDQLRRAVEDLAEIRAVFRAIGLTLAAVSFDLAAAAQAEAERLKTDNQAKRSAAPPATRPRKRPKTKTRPKNQQGSRQSGF